jgi:hypothetical protein
VTVPHESSTAVRGGSPPTDARTDAPTTAGFTYSRLRTAKPEAFASADFASDDADDALGEVEHAAQAAARRAARPTRKGERRVTARASRCDYSTMVIWDA